MAIGPAVPSGSGSGGKAHASEDRPEVDEESVSPVGKREREEEEIDGSVIPYKVGQHIDVLDSVDRWAEAKILKIDVDNRRLYVTFLYWSHHFDTWVHDIGRRCAYLHTHTYSPGGVLRVGQRLDVLDEINKWMEAFVADETPSEVLIHFKGYSKKFDVWLPRDSPRIRQFGFGENKRNRAVIPQKIWAVPGQPKAQAVDRTRKITVASDNYVKYISALAARELHVYPVAGDGNCLFRSVAHQMYGDDSLHDLVREKCMDYMEVNASFFSMFVEGGLESFHNYLAMKRQLSCWGDDPEIQAMCEIYGRRAEIWSFDPAEGARRLRTYHDAEGRSGSGVSVSAFTSAMILSFYGGGHYDSILGPSFFSAILSTQPGVVEDNAISRARALVADGRADRHRAISGPSVSGAEATLWSDVQATENAALEMALSISRKDMEAYGEEDIETCLALSLSSLDTHIKGSPSRFDHLIAESKGGIPSTGLDIDASGAKDRDLDLNDKAVLDLVLKESAAEHKEGTEVQSERVVRQSEDDLIESQILEQARQDSLGGDSVHMGYDELALALQRSEEEMIQEAIRISQIEQHHGGGGRSVATSQIIVDSNGIHGAVDEDEMLRLAIQQSVESTATGAYRGNNTSNNGQQGSNYSGQCNDEDDDDELRRAIAASMQDI